MRAFTRVKVYRISLGGVYATDAEAVCRGGKYQSGTRAHDWAGRAGGAVSLRVWHGHLHSTDGQGLSHGAVTNCLLHGGCRQPRVDGGVTGWEVRVVPAGGA